MSDPISTAPRATEPWCGELRACARAAWGQAIPREKAVAAATIGRDAAVQSVNPAVRFDDVLRPGRPERPLLVHPSKVAQRGVGSCEGRAALLHAIAHIEFNAIDLALDAVWRFPAMPIAWYRDWASVAAEEALHFTMVCDELARRGHAYGDFDAHDGLWDMAMRTRDDPLARMALVPRLMEARGLDVTPLIQRRLGQAGDTDGCALLQRILDDEVGHVAIGNHWYGWLCARAGVDAVLEWDAIAQRLGVCAPRPPLNEAARLRAGFTEIELERWR